MTAKTEWAQTTEWAMTQTTDCLEWASTTQSLADFAALIYNRPYVEIMRRIPDDLQSIGLRRVTVQDRFVDLYGEIQKGALDLASVGQVRIIVVPKRPKHRVNFTFSHSASIGQVPGGCIGVNVDTNSGGGVVVFGEYEWLPENGKLIFDIYRVAADNGEKA